MPNEAVIMSSRARLNNLVGLFGFTNGTLPEEMKKIIQSKCRQNDLPGWISFCLSAFRGIEDGPKGYDYDRCLQDGKTILKNLSSVLQNLPGECDVQGKCVCSVWAEKVVNFLQPRMT